MVDAWSGKSLTMLALRRLWTVIVGAWVAAILARAVLGWILGLEGAGVFAVVLAATAVGGLMSLGAARQVQPMDPDERRDSILGWGVLVGGVGSVACLFLPLPWNLLAAVAVLALTVGLLLQVPKSPAGRGSQAKQL
jgi:hypothetical protein